MRPGPWSAQVLAQDSTATVSLTADSLASDSASMAGEELAGLVITAPGSQTPLPPRPTAGEPSSAMSWVFMAIAVLFFLTAVRFRKCPFIFKAMLSDLTVTRVRQNAFDETVNESSIIILLNIVWAVGAGICLWSALGLLIPADGTAYWSFTLPARPAAGIGICTGICAAYLLLMRAAYWVVGRVFSDRAPTSAWLRGADAANAIEALPLLLISLVLLCYPSFTFPLLIFASIIFIMGKIMFILKGFRIFFTHFSSWLLFLYYLCSLEIVPLIITAISAVALCGTLL